MKMKTSILNSITETHLVLLLHYVIIFLLILGFYACSKTGAKSNPTLPPDQKSTNIKEAGSGVSASTLVSDSTDWHSGTPISRTEKS
jgi:hypothetical protein